MKNIEDGKEILKELRKITKNKENWNIIIDDVAIKLNENYSVNVKAKVLFIYFPFVQNSIKVLIYK